MHRVRRFKDIRNKSEENPTKAVDESTHTNDTRVPLRKPRTIMLAFLECPRSRCAELSPYIDQERTISRIKGMNNPRHFGNRAPFCLLSPVHLFELQWIQSFHPSTNSKRNETHTKRESTEDETQQQSFLARQHGNETTKSRRISPSSPLPILPFRHRPSSIKHPYTHNKAS